MKKVFYEKVGREYIPVAEYDSDLSSSFTEGSHLVTVRPGITSFRRVIDPAFAPMIAAGIYAEDSLIESIVRATALRPTHAPLTEEQREAWVNLNKTLGNDAHTLSWPAAGDAAREIVTALQSELNSLLSNVAVKNAYDEFLLICKLTKETK